MITLRVVTRDDPDLERCMVQGTWMASCRDPDFPDTLCIPEGEWWFERFAFGVRFSSDFARTEIRDFVQELEEYGLKVKRAEVVVPIFAGVVVWPVAL